MLLSTLALARRVERAENDFCALAAGYESACPVQTLNAGGGRAVFGRLGSPLNKVLGLGLGERASDADLAAIEQFKVSEDIGYISTGGGAFLEFIEGKTLPAIAALLDRASVA